MRNLKRALSLTLASVMLLGMMVVGAGAAGYPDVDSNDNAEAIEVLQAVKVMVGDDNGNFGPDDQVNRAQMAVVMALLLDLNYDYYEGADPGFWDVPSWAAPYVAACYANGIVSGYGNGQYGSADSVTAVQAASMMMRALGYFKYQSDYKEGFELSTVSQASKLRLFDGIAAKSNEPLTRNDVAQLALNTLKTPIVEPSDKTISFTDANGNVVATGGQVDYVVVASNQPFAQAIDRVERSGDGLNQVNGYTVELGEQLYNGKLELRDNGQDDFGRPARTWVYNGTEIGSYAKKELLRQSYTAAVKGKTIYELVGQAPIRDYTLLPYLDGAVNSNITEGVLTRNNNTDLYGTGRGVLTEVYLDNNRDELYIVSINTWLARASADYNSNSESITMTVYDGINSTISKRVELEDAPFIMNMKKDDWCLINWNGDVLDGSSDKVVANVFDVEIREDQKVTAFKRGVDEYNNTNTGRQDRVTQMTANGETYDNNKKAFYKYNTLNEFNANELVNKTYTMFMDQYGYFIGAELYSGKDQYVFITGYDRNGSNISVNTAKASAIFTDGTMQAIDVNAKDTDKNIKNYNDKNYSTGYDELKDCDYVRWSTRTAALNHDGYEWENMWYKYSLYNGVYTLTPVDEYTKEINTDTNSSGVGVDRTINAKKVYLVPTRGVAGESLNRDGRSYGEDASIYITVDNGDVDLGSTKGITDVTGVYTGAQDVNLVLPHGRWIHAVYDDTYIVAAIVFGDAEGSVNNYAYIRSGANHEQVDTVDGSTIHYWDFDAVMDGETVTKTIKSKFSNTVNDLRPGTVQELILDNDGYVTKIKDVEDNRPGEGSVDKTYNNANFNAGHKTLADYEAYQIATTYSDPVPNGWIIDAPQAGPAIPGAILLNNGRYASTLTFQGNTLHYSANANDIGLPVSRNAKAVVYQRINNGNSWENYGSVQSAYNVLNDADTVTPGKQFDGQVIAVLDSNGVAAWVVFIDATPTNSNTGINTGTDTYTDGNITVTVNNTNIKARDVSANVTNGNLTITIPTSVNRTAGYDRNGLRVEVTVNGRYYGLAEYVRSTSSRYVYTMDGLALRATDKVVITISAEKDAPVYNYVETVTMTEAPKTAVVGDEVKVSATVDGAAVAEKAVTFTKAGTETLEYTITAPAGKLFSSSKNYSSNGWTATVSSDGKTLTMSCTVEVTETPVDPETVKVNLGTSAADDATAKNVTAAAENGKVTVTGLGTKGNLKALVVKDGAKVGETTKDGAMEWPEGAELWVLKGKTTVEIDSSGLLIPTTTWDETEAGVTSRMMRMARAAEGERTYKFVSRYESYATIKLGNEVFDLEQVTVLFDGETEPTVAYKFLKKDITKANEALKDVDVSGGLNIETEWTKNTIPVELPGKEDVVEIPVGADGEPVLNLEYTAGEESGEANATLVIKAKPGVEEVYKINGQIVTEEGMTPTQSDKAEIVDSNDPLLTELPFTLSVPAGSKLLKRESSKKVENIQKDDVAVSYNKETKTFTITGNLIYNSALTDYSTVATRNSGYFAALDLDWSKMGSEYSIKLITYKDNDPKGELVEKELTSATEKELLLARVAGADGEVLDMPSRGIRLTDVRTNTSTFYKIDFSGVTCPAPELLQFSAYDEVKNKDSNLLGKTIGNVQSGVSVEVVETGKDTRTIKLTGTLHPITGWTQFNSSVTEQQSGYFVVINADPSAMAKTNITSINANTGGTSNVLTDKLTGEDPVLILRVAGLADKLTGQAATEGNCVIYATNGKMITYTIDFSGLTLEPRGSGEAVLTPMTGKITDNKFDEKDASEFQKNLAIELRGDTFYFTGELTPVKWTKGWGTDKDGINKGYYVWFEMDGSGIAGAAAYSVRGTQGGNAEENKGEFLFHLGNEKLTVDKIKDTTLYVLTEKYTGSEGDTPGAGKILKTYKLDFSGVTLKQSVPFTVSHELSDENDAGAVHQSLLCNGANYKVTVDHSTKEIIVTGDVYMISEGNAPYAWSIVTGKTLGFKKTESGYFVTFEMKPSSVGGFTKYNQAGYNKQYKESDTTYTSGVVTQVIRVAPMSGNDPYGAVKVYVGNEGTVGIEYTLNLKGVNWVSDYKETTTAPSET